jgi:hypothetical protein
MSSHSFPNACCKDFPRLALRFLDESSELDAPLETIASLCLAATSTECIEPETLVGVGTEIRRYLDHRRTVESGFFDRHLHPNQMDNPATASELRRIRSLIRAK